MCVNQGHIWWEKAILDRRRHSTAGFSDNFFVGETRCQC